VSAKRPEAICGDGSGASANGQLSGKLQALLWLHGQSGYLHVNAGKHVGQAEIFSLCLLVPICQADCGMACFVGASVLAGVCIALQAAAVTAAIAKHCMRGCRHCLLLLCALHASASSCSYHI
jgi:hypothetical protein